MKYVIIAIIIGFLGLGIFSYIHNKRAENSDNITNSNVAPVPAVTVVDQTPVLPTTQEPKKTDTKNINKIIKTQNGMTIEILKEGAGEAITNGKTASMKYTGMLTDGTVFDSTDKHGGTPFDFLLGAGQVIKGWDQGVLGMKVGEQRKLTIPSDLAYGPSGIPGVIPGGATLVFTIELVSFK